MIKGGKRIILMPWRQFQTSSPMAIFCGHFVYGLNLCSYLPMWFKLLYEKMKTIADRNIKFNALKIQLSPKLNVSMVTVVEFHRVSGKIQQIFVSQ